MLAEPCGKPLFPIARDLRMNNHMRGNPNAASAASRETTATQWTSRSGPWRLALSVGISLLVADCASQSVISRNSDTYDPKLGVHSSRRVYQDGQNIPKGGGQRLVGHAYSVAGRTYVPHEVSHYSVVGSASWYGSAFHGRLTANGEIFDRYSISAAHKTLPLPSYARVTNIRNGRSIVVRVNDRGPYHSNRVMDVSERVADVLDFRRAGTTEIKLDYLGPAGLAGSDDRRLLATLKTDGTMAAPNGMGSAMVASADLTPGASGLGAPIAAVASAITGSTEAPPMASYVAPSPKSEISTVAYSSSAGRPLVASPAFQAEPPASSSEDEPAALASTTTIRNDASAHMTTALAPMPPDRPFTLGVTTVAKTRRGSDAPSSSSEGEAVAPRPPVRPKQLAALFFGPERLGTTKAFVPGSPFFGLKPQAFVPLRAP